MQLKLFFEDPRSVSLYGSDFVTVDFERPKSFVKDEESKKSLLDGYITQARVPKQIVAAEEVTKTVTDASAVLLTGVQLGALLLLSLFQYSA